MDRGKKKKTLLIVVVTMCVCVCFKVWQIRVDVHMLNHDGNLMDAASIAAITALCHFRRPDVGIQGDEVKVVSRQHTQSRCCLCFTESTGKCPMLQTPNSGNINAFECFVILY